jgi:hypothetical protein
VSLLSGIVHAKNLSITAKDSISFARKRRFFNAKIIQGIYVIHLQTETAEKASLIILFVLTGIRDETEGFFGVIQSLYEKKFELFSFLRKKLEPDSNADSGSNLRLVIKKATSCYWIWSFNFCSPSGLELRENCRLNIH